MHRFLSVGAAVTVALATVLLTGLAPIQAQTGFYVAVAPYVATTHPCTYHVKGSCQGELTDVVLRYWLRSTDGAVARTGTVRTGADGFIDWWVPHNKSYVVTFEYEGQRGSGTFTSFPKDPSCITTVQLK